MKTKKKKLKTKSDIKPTRVVFLLDRTGSMQSVKQETISGFNGYLDSLAKSPRTTITVVQFDSQAIEKLSDSATVKDCVRLNKDNYVPRAMTPLYDALGKTITDTKATVKYHKVLFVTLTDGQENASSEWSHDRVKALMKECEDKDHWTFAYIGVGPQGWEAMKEVSKGLISASNVLKIQQDGKSIKRAYARAGGQSVCYASSAIGSDAPVTDFWGKNDPE